MKLKNIIPYLLLIISLLPVNNFCQSLTISSLFTDNMVIQAGKENRIWGKAVPGSQVSVAFKEQNKNTITNDKGDWEVYLEAENYGGPFQLVIKGSETISLKNVMIGEVWICSGQSNMSMPLAGWGRVDNYEVEIQNADHPDIRLFSVPLTLANEPFKNSESKGWAICTPEAIENFSAVSYFFARELIGNLHVPIGLILVAKGGTPIESWISEDALEKFPEFKKDVTFVKNSSPELFKKLDRQYKKDLSDWLEDIYDNDPGFVSNQEWFKSSTDYSTWQSMEIPTVWEKAGLPDYDGVVWFQRNINIPSAWLDQDVTLCLGPVQDYDITYVNGEKIGEQKKANDLSKYIIPKSILRNGENSIVTRVLDQYGVGGLWGRRSEIYIANKDGEKINLAGEWKYKPALDFNEKNLLPPDRVRLDRKPTILYNGMVSPLIGLTFRGVIWYQGESNAERAYQYRELFPIMINDWRARMNQGSFPFLFVQLANYKDKSEQPEESSWAELREAQAMCLKIENTGMATAIDIGNDVDVHPKNKKEVGRRLALLAREEVYHEEIQSRGPVFKSFQIADDKIIVSFEEIGSGLKINGDDKLLGFTIAGNDKKFYKADAEIMGDQVIVSSKDVPVPVAVRYAWASNPECNLYNNENLPAYPFRSDEWPGITYGKK